MTEFCSATVPDRWGCTRRAGHAGDHKWGVKFCNKCGENIVLGHNPRCKARAQVEAGESA